MTINIQFENYAETYFTLYYGDNRFPITYDYDFYGLKDAMRYINYCLITNDNVVSADIMDAHTGEIIATITK